MYFFKLATFLLLAATVHAALVNSDFISQELQRYKVRVGLIHQLLLKECPNEQLEKIIHKRETNVGEKVPKIELENEKVFYAHILKQLAECREAKLAIATKKATLSTLPASSSTTTMVSPTPSSTRATTPQLSCQYQYGYLKTSIDFVNYRNPSGNKATGVGCDEEDKTQCDIYFDICISHTDMRDCGLYNNTTELIGEGLSLVFSADLGGVPNPLTLDLGDQKWVGLNILVKVWDKDEGKPSDDLVNEFTYNFTDSPGSPSRTVDLESVMKERKSRLQLTIRSFCPSTVTTKMTATTIATITTISSTQTPPPASCGSAVNLTESWRGDNNGSGKKNNCDTQWMTSNGRPWFRFVGEAGSRLLESCPPDYSCGTHIGMWSKDVMPASVGVAKDIMAYGSQYDRCQPTYRMSVMRCSSSPHDFIYRYDDPVSGCTRGFCGML